MTAVLLALVAAVTYGVSDFVGGIASRRVAALRVVLVSYPVSLVIALAVAPLAGGSPTWSTTMWGAVSGVASGFAIWWFYLALADGPMSVVSPLTAILVAGIPVVVGFAAGERPGGLAIAGVVLALVAVVLVSRETPETAGEAVDGHRVGFTPKVAWLTVGAGVAFAVSFVGLDRIGDDSGLWPLAVSRAAATAAVWVAAAGMGQFRFPPRSVVRLAIGISVLDVIANGAMMYAFSGGMLSLVAVIGSLYPAATVLLAMTVLGERVGGLQKVGMGLAVAAVAMIAVA
ncbi:EamA family transporter [Rhodococcus sp. NPDC003318]|uniref:EamA family transporter n=1 Tax=Rhodococcus sp. NPDC003318 TaxID=3364503 RepID=UPI0036CE9612